MPSLILEPIKQMIAYRSFQLQFFVLITALCGSTVSIGDTYSIQLQDNAASGSVSGRLILFFISEEEASLRSSIPIDGPFFKSPQPIASVDVQDLKPGESAEIDGASLAYPDSIDSLDGRFRVQAILDIYNSVSSFRKGPGNVYSDVVSVNLRPSVNNHIKLTLSNAVPKRKLPAELPNLKWISFRSNLLSDFYNRDIFHNAGIALPQGYDSPENEGKKWPTIYVIPGFGGRQESAVNYATMLRLVDAEYTPQAVWIVLDPDSPLGHHGFADSENNGPRGTALVTEFIPHLEEEFRLDKDSNARLLYGHSSGGWSVLWLQLNWPDTFGGCWSSAPDPIDFSAFQFSNLYKDRNLYQYAEGNETPSYRTVDFEDRDNVHMTVRQEAMMEYVINPKERSGQQWDAWEAMFSPKDENTGWPKPMFNSITGEINKEVVTHWKKYDIYEMIRTKWDKHKPVLENKVRLFCGEHDNFYLNRAVSNMKEMVELRAGVDWQGPGYVEIIKFAAHGSVIGLTAERMHKEMIEHLKSVTEDE